MYPSQGSTDSEQTVTCNQHFDYCLIELETQLSIDPLVQAIGIEEPKPSSWPNEPILVPIFPNEGGEGGPIIEPIFPINIGQSTSSTIKPTLTSASSGTATTFTSTEGLNDDSDTNNLDGPNLERCWIAAWSDDILRTTFAELEDMASIFGLPGSEFKDTV